MVDPRPDDTDQLPTYVDRLQTQPLIITAIPLLRAAFHLCCIVGHQGKTLEATTSSDRPRGDKVVEGKRVEGPESASQTLHGLIDGFGGGVNAVGIVASSSRILDVVLCLELLEALRASIVNVLSVGNELRRGRRSVGGRHFDVEDGLMV